jgi:hypothetical protein
MSSTEWLKVDDNRLKPLNNAAIYDAFSRFSLPPGLLSGSLGQTQEGGLAPCPAPIAAVFGELLTAAVEMLGVMAPDVRVECWNNRCKGSGSAVDYHLDNDEQLRRRTGEVRTPDHGLIFHAGPEQDGIGGTYFNPPLDDPLSDANLFEHPRYHDVLTDEGRLVPFAPGRLIVFNGRCPHCVEPFADTDLPRVTILANFWAR